MTAKKTKTGDAASINTTVAPQSGTDGSENDASHVAVDFDPRKGTSETQNRIDFNDPRISGQEAVAKNLNAGE